MNPETDTAYFVLREGATQEEHWEWCDLEAMCESGELTAGARVFMPEEGEWVQISQTDLAEHLSQPASEGDTGDPVRETLELDYKATVARLGEQPGSLDLLVEAGVLAHELGDVEVARGHFQAALDVQPYNGRVAQEVKRRFSRLESGEFRSLERPAAAWDDLGETAVFAFSRGPLYVAIPAVVLALSGILPIGFLPGAVLALLWTVVVARSVAAGATEIPHWTAFTGDPVRSLLWPAAAAVLVCVELGAIVYAIARLAMLLDGWSLGVAKFIAGSPVMIVVTALLTLAWVPAALVELAGKRPLRAALPWRVMTAAVRIELEYVIATLLIAVVVLVCGGLYILASRVPVLADLLIAVAVAVLAPAAGLILGRLRARHEHVLR